MTSDEAIIKIRKILRQGFAFSGMEQLAKQRGNQLLEISLAAYACVPGREMPDDDPRLSAAMGSAIADAGKPDDGKGFSEQIKKQAFDSMRIVGNIHRGGL